MSEGETRISRRWLLQRAIAGGAAFGLADALGRPGAARAAGEYRPVKMGFKSYTLRHKPQHNDNTTEAPNHGQSYLELYRCHLDPDKPSTDNKGAMGPLRAAGLRVSAFGVENFTADHERNERLFRFAKFLGAENLSANPSKDAFGSLEKLVKAHDLKIAIHNHGPEDREWRRPEWILNAVKGLDPRIGACADLGHYIRAGVDPVAALEMLGPRVLGCHFKDFDKQGKDVVVGKGQLDVVKALATLKKIGFSGPLSLEFEGDESNPVPAMLECLGTIRSAIAKI
jgi:sugar phosphate isomerase/epimerase